MSHSDNRPRSYTAAAVARHRAKGCRIDLTLQNPEAIEKWRRLLKKSRSHREAVEKLILAADV